MQAVTAAAAPVSGSTDDGCGEGLVRIDDVAASESAGKVTLVVHQTARSRCVTPVFAKNAADWQKWNAGGGYTLHTDEDV